MQADNLTPFREEWRSNMSAQGFYFLDTFSVVASCQLKGGNVKDGDKIKCMKCLV